MDLLLLLLPPAAIMSAVGLGFFAWALRNGQYDDLEGPRWRLLFDDEDKPA